MDAVTTIESYFPFTRHAPRRVPDLEFGGLPVYVATRCAFGAWWCDRCRLWEVHDVVHVHVDGDAAVTANLALVREWRAIG